MVTLLDTSQVAGLALSIFPVSIELKVRSVENDAKFNTYSCIWTVYGPWEVDDNFAHPVLVGKLDFVATDENLHDIFVSPSIVHAHHLAFFSFLSGELVKLLLFYNSSHELLL